jgi:hypothetical protein
MTTNDPAADAAGPADGAVIADAEVGWPSGVPPILNQAFDAGMPSAEACACTDARSAYSVPASKA